LQLRDGAEPLTAETLGEFCADRISHHKIPRYVHVVDEFPMTVTGKVRKVEMRERAVELLGLRDVADRRHA
ncbi:MAG: AMP-binding protein, partial [Actinophytocola sp.]|nr:AMP-binding protein [Actinophytocola sp.]